MGKILQAIVVALIVYSVWQITLNIINPNDESEVVTKIEYITVYKDTVIYKPVPYFVIDTIEVSIWDTLKLHDTVYIKEYVNSLYKDYNAERRYFNTFNLDTLGAIDVISVVNQNVLKEIQFTSNLIIPEYTTTITNNKIRGVGLMSGHKDISPTFIYGGKRIIYIGNYNILEHQPRVGALIRF